MKGVNTVTVTVSGIPIKVTKKNVKHYRFRISLRSREVSLSAPLSAKDGEISRVIEKRLDWILSHLGEVPPPRRYETGERVRYFGALCPLVVVEDKRRAAMLGERGEVLLFCRSDDNAERRSQILAEWYRAEARRAAEALLPALVKKSGLKPAALRISAAKSRWGSCNVSKKAVMLSLRLAEHPIACLEFVLMHELVHLRWHGHGKHFYDTLASLMPDWQQRKRLLSESERRAGLDWMPTGEEDS
jgi:predicted metal-dependent hydrolase